MKAENQKTILLVEDEAITAMSEKMILEKIGYQVIIATTGEASVKAVEKTPAIDLILMDINLGKGMDGTEAAAIILKNRDLPVIFLSSHTEPEVVAKTEKITSYGYVVKNSSNTVLDASIKMAFKLFAAKKKEQQKEAALRESEASYRVLFVDASDGILLADAQTRQFRYANPAICRMLGYTENEFQRLSVADIHPKESLDRVLAEFTAQVLGEIKSSSELPCLRKDGTVFYADISHSAMTLEGREYHAGFFHDITERKRTEKALRDSEKRYRELFDHIGSGAAIYEVVGNGSDFIFKDLNQAGERLDGARKEDVIGKSIYQVRPGIDRFGLLEVFKRVFATGIPEQYPAKFYLDEKLQGWYDNFVYRLPTGEIVAVYDNVTERKRAEEALRESEEKYRILVENSHDIIFTLSLDWVFTFASPSWTTLLGHPLDQVVGKSFQQFVHPDDFAGCMAMLQKMIDTGQRQDAVVAYRVRHSDGSWRWHIANAVPIKDAAGTVFGVESIARDITERKRAESEKESALEALQKNEEKFRNMAEQLEDVLFTTDDYGTITYISSSAYRVFGWLPEEMIGRKFVEFLMENDISKAIQAFQTTISSGRPNQNLSLLMKRKDGSFFNGELKGSPLDKKRGILGTLGLIRDISEFKKAEAALIESEERYRTLIENASDLVYRTDPAGRFTYVNRAGLRFTGYEEGELLGKFYPSLIRPDMRNRAVEIFIQQTRKRTPNTYSEFPILAKDGGELWLGQNTQLIVQNGQVTGFQAVSRDITGRKRAEEEIRHQLEEKEILLKEVHHRIKNNIASIAGLLTLHMQSIAEPKAVAVLQEAIGRVDSMRLLYEKLLHSGDFQDASVKNYIESLAAAVVSLFPGNAAVSLETQVDDFKLDPKRLFPLGIIINELMTNVMKYAFIEKKSGRITLSLVKENNQVTLVIQDNGVGLAENIAGSEAHGFGLTLVKMLSQQLGGSFAMEKNKGTRCVVEFNI